MPIYSLAELLAPRLGEQQPQPLDLQRGGRDQRLGLVPGLALGQDHRMRRDEVAWQGDDRQRLGLCQPCLPRCLPYRRPQAQAYEALHAQDKRQGRPFARLRGLRPRSAQSIQTILADGPTCKPLRARPSGPRPCAPGCTATTAGDHTRRWEANRLFPACPGTTSIATTASEPVSQAVA